MTGTAAGRTPAETSGEPRTLRDQQRALTRRRILDAAQLAFTQTGVAAATLDQIARDAGISRATLYLHFANKDAILVDLLARDLRSVQATFKSLPEAVRSGPAATREWVRAHADQVRRHRSHLNLFNIATATDAAAVSLVNAHLVKVAEIVLGPCGSDIRSSDRALWTRVILMIARINQVVSGLAISDPELEPEIALDIAADEIMAVIGPRWAA